MQKKRDLKNNKRTLLLDIDGTINTEYPSITLYKNAELVSKDPYGQRIWDLFEKSTKNIKAKPQFIPFAYFKKIREHFENIYIVTARIEPWRPQTEAWLKKWGFEYDSLFMRPVEYMEWPSHKLKDWIVKKHILPNHSAEDCFSCDDELSICQMYQSHGITPFQAPIDWPLFIKSFSLKVSKFEEKQEGLLKHYFLKEFKKGKTLVDIAQELGCSFQLLTNIKSQIKKVGTLPTPRPPSKIDIEPFKYMNSELAAYVVGLSTAGASIELNSKAGAISWFSNANDLEIVQQIKKKLKIKDKIKVTGHSADLTVSQKALANIMVYRWGLTNKRFDDFKLPQKIPSNMLNHYLRGIYECHIGYFNVPENIKQFKYELQSASPEFLIGIENALRNRGIECLITTEGSPLVLRVLPESERDMHRFLYNKSTIFSSKLKYSK